MSKTFKEQLQEIATDEQFHPAQVYALSRMDKESLAEFREIWPSVPVERRRTVLDTLVDITEVNFEVDFDPIFLLSMGDEDASVRASAVRGLWEHEHPSLIRPLIHLLKTDPVEQVREAAATALGKFIYLHELEELATSEATLAEEALLETIYNGAETIDVRRRAIESIAYSSDPRVPSIIEAAYYHDDQKMQVSAVFAMGRNADGRWVPTVLQELDNSISEIRFEAARACGELEINEAVGKLIELVEQEDDFEVQEVSIWALGRIGGKVAREALEICVEHDNEALALAAEDALAELNMFHDALMLYDFGDFDDLDDEDLVDIADVNDGYPSLKDYLN